MLVDCGVEPGNAERAEKEILNQLEDIKKGDLTDEDLAASISSIKESLVCLNDSESAIDNWYSMRIFGDPITPEDYIKMVEKVTLKDVIKAANLYKLDTVYQIMPQDTEGDN